MASFLDNNTPSFSDVSGFCVKLPRWTRTIRSVLKWWRYDMVWECTVRGRELVVKVVQDQQPLSSHETGLELWRLPVSENEAQPDRDVGDVLRLAEMNAEFKVAHLEWVLNQALNDTVQPELEQQGRTHAQEILRVERENAQLITEIQRRNDLLALVSSALTSTGTAKQKRELKATALEALEAAAAQPSVYDTASVWCKITKVPDKKIHAIKMVRQYTGMGIVEAKAAVEGREFRLPKNKLVEFTTEYQEQFGDKPQVRD